MLLYLASRRAGLWLSVSDIRRDINIRRESVNVHKFTERRGGSLRLQSGALTPVASLQPHLQGAYARNPASEKYIKDDKRRRVPISKGVILDILRSPISPAAKVTLSYLLITTSSNTPVNVAQAARALGVHRDTLYEALKQIRPLLRPAPAHVVDKMEGRPGHVLWLDIRQIETGDSGYITRLLERHRSGGLSAELEMTQSVSYLLQPSSDYDRDAVVYHIVRNRHLEPEKLAMDMMGLLPIPSIEVMTTFVEQCYDLMRPAREGDDIDPRDLRREPERPSDETSQPTPQSITDEEREDLLMAQCGDILPDYEHRDSLIREVLRECVIFRSDKPESKVGPISRELGISSEQATDIISEILSRAAS